MWVGGVLNKNQEYKRRKVICGDMVTVLVQGNIVQLLLHWDQDFCGMLGRGVQQVVIVLQVEHREL